MEQRSVVIGGAELRAASNFVIEGKAVTYNKPSPDNQLAPGAREVVLPGAFKQSIQRGGFQGDCKALVNHDPNRVLGRLKNGTLQLFDSPEALRFSIQLDRKQQAHQDVYASVQRGDLNECSFSFVVDKDGGQAFIDDRDSQGAPCKTRQIIKAELSDVSLVVFPFYSDPGSTSAEARARAALKVNETHGLLEAIKVLRKAAAMAARDIKFVMAMRGSFGDQVDFASHMQRCQEYGEFLVSQMDQAWDVLNSEDGDPDDNADESCRMAFRKAHAHARFHGDELATARLLYEKKKAAKKK
jgi:uncharacterized protein